MPAEAVEGVTLMRGEKTGHRHLIAENDGRARLHLADHQLFLTLTASATLVHEEHGPIQLPPGTYRIWQQREYAPPRPDQPAGFRPVVD